MPRTPRRCSTPDLDGKTVREILDEANAAIGEKIEVRRVARVEGAAVASYLHKTSPDLPPQVGVLFAMDGETPVARDVAMHIAAFPETAFVTRDEVPAETVETERRIATTRRSRRASPRPPCPRSSRVG